MRYLWFWVLDQPGNNTATVRACVCQGDRVLGITLPLIKYSQENTVGTGTRYNTLALYKCNFANIGPRNSIQLLIRYAIDRECQF